MENVEGAQGAAVHQQKSQPYVKDENTFYFFKFPREHCNRRDSAGTVTTTRTT